MHLKANLKHRLASQINTASFQFSSSLKILPIYSCEFPELFPPNSYEMATSPSLIPDQEQLQPQESVPNPVAVSSTASAGHSSGSIGPFFAVIFVLTVLAIISCFAGRICKGRSITPLEHIKHGGRLGWLRRKCGACANNDAEVLGNKATESNDGKAQESV